MSVIEAGELAPKQARVLAPEPDVRRVALSRASDGRVMVRRNAALLLSMAPNLTAEEVAAFHIARKDEDAVVRIYATRGLAKPEVPDADAIVGLLALLNDTVDPVWKQAAKGLSARLADAGARGFKLTVSSLARGGTLVVLTRVTPIFAKLGGPAMVTLAACLGHTNKTLRRWSKDTLIAHFGAAAIPTLIQALTKPRMRDGAIATIEALPHLDASHAAALRALATSPKADQGTRDAAARGLSAANKAILRALNTPASVAHPDFYKRRLSSADLDAAAEQSADLSTAALRYNLRDGRGFVKANSVDLMARVVEASENPNALAEVLGPLAKDEDAAVRAAVAAQAGTIAKAAAVPLLVALLDDPETSVRQAAQAALEGLKLEAIGELIAGLGVARSAPAQRVLLGILGAHLKVALPALRAHAAAAAQPLGRAGAIGALTHLDARTPGDRRLYLDALTDEDAHVRIAAALGLGRLFVGDAAIADTLTAHARAESVPAVRRAAARSADRARGKTPSPKVKPVAVLPFKGFDTDRLTPQAMAKQLKALKLAVLMPLFTDGRATVRYNTALGLGFLPTWGDAADEVARWLVVALKDEDRRVRAAAAVTVAAKTPAPAALIPPLASALGAAADATDRAFMRALCAYGPRALSPALEALSVREHIAPEAIKRLTTVIPATLYGALADHLERPSTYAVRRLAAGLLGAAGEAAAETWDQLCAAAEEPLGRLRIQVVGAMGRVGPPTLPTFAALVQLGREDARLSVKTAVDAALRDVIARVDPEALAASGGPTGQMRAWLAEMRR